MLRPGLFSVLFLACSLALNAAPTLVQGELHGAKFSVARPEKWNHQLLLLAHGLRAESSPIVADLFPDKFAYKTLLDEGWMIAKTSYRRNGPIVVDAIADLDALREHIAHTYGRPERVLLEGESMGGLIVALMAEREPEHYAGAVALGAALGFRENNMAIGLSLQPKIPLLFVSNRNELGGPENYVIAKVPRESAELRPALFSIARDGHVNVNQRERLAALRALVAWLDSGRDALPRPAEGARFFDATVLAEPQPSLVTLHPDGRGFDAKVTEVSAIFGNLLLNAHPEDFAAAGIKPMAWFQLKVGDKVYRTRYGRDVKSVKRGEWVVYPNADGFSWLSRNYENAAATLDISNGATVTLRRYDQ